MYEGVEHFCGSLFLGGYTVLVLNVNVELGVLLRSRVTRVGFVAGGSLLGGYTVLVLNVLMLNWDGSAVLEISERKFFLLDCQAKLDYGVIYHGRKLILPTSTFGGLSTI